MTISPTPHNTSTHIPDNLITAEPAGRPIPSDPDATLYPAEGAYIAGVSTGTFANWRVQGKGPAFIKYGKSIRYRRADVLQWIADQRFSSTSEAGARS